MKNNKANLKCPHCGQIFKTEIPEEKCLPFIKCEKCQKLIIAPDNKCCVFCAYSDKKCPTNQESL